MYAAIDHAGRGYMTVVCNYCIVLDERVAIDDAIAPDSRARINNGAMHDDRARS